MADTNIDQLRAEYDKLAAQVSKLAEGQEKRDLMEQKKQAFTKWHDADRARRKTEAGLPVSPAQQPGVQHPDAAKEVPIRGTRGAFGSPRASTTPTA